jgi:hypothetical protein
MATITDNMTQRTLTSISEIVRYCSRSYCKETHRDRIF